METIKYNVYFRNNKNVQWEFYAMFCEEQEMKEQFANATQKHSEVKVVKKIIKEQDEEVVIWRNGHYKLNNLT